MGIAEQKESAEKPRRPFRLGTTSFIFPDHILPNVQRLGRFFDEIELLVFESQPPDVLPSPADIGQLKALSRDLNVSYNIHLPVDVSLTDPARDRRQRGIDTLVRVMELVSPLNPTTHTLHLDLDPDLEGPGSQSPSGRIQAWRDRVNDSLTLLCARIPDPARISIETLDYPFEYLDGLIRSHGLSVCIDAGHLIRHCYSITRLFAQYGDIIPIMHLHGVDRSTVQPRDHQGLDRTSDREIEDTLVLLEQFHGIVSLEVFNAANLNASLRYLERFWTLFDPELSPTI